MACPRDGRRRRIPAPSAAIPPGPAPPPEALTKPFTAARDAERAWRLRLLQAELRGIESGLIRASRGPGAPDRDR